MSEYVRRLLHEAWADEPSASVEAKLSVVREAATHVPMYLVGAEHPNKESARRVLERLVAGRTRLVTDADVIQEILRRYTAIEHDEEEDGPSIRGGVGQPVEESGIRRGERIVALHGMETVEGEGRRPRDQRGGAPHPGAGPAGGA